MTRKMCCSTGILKNYETIGASSDVQCPKKVKGQFTFFQIIERQTSLKDVTALKLMT